MRLALCWSKRLGVVGLAAFVGCAVAPAVAGTITYSFSGHVTDVGSNMTPKNPPSGFVVPFNTTTLKTMTGTMTINTSGSHSQIGNTTGSVGGYVIQNFDVTVGAYHATFNSADGHTVTIRNATTGNGPGADRFLVFAGVNGMKLGDPLRDSKAFTINLRGFRNLFAGDALPNLPPPHVGSFVTNTFRLQFGNGNGIDRAVIGKMDSITAVPLSSAAILFGIGLVALIGLGAGGLRNLRLPQG